METIDSFKGEFGFLSNFWPSPFRVSVWNFATVEHYFQACKMTTTEDFEAVRTARSPGIAKRLARAKTRRDDWDNIKETYMLTALRMKFQIPALREQLLATGDAILREGNTWGDIYWGVCKGKGQNRLGVLLMQLRQEIRDNYAQKP
jgi:ribA/ribD-fused uncharacterized protein